MTIFQILTNKLMSQNTLHNFRILYAALLIVKKNDHQNLLDNPLGKVHEHEFRISLLKLFENNQTGIIEFYKILLTDEELFLWNDTYNRPVKFISGQ